MFEKRIANFGIIFVGDGPGMKDRIDQGDSVVLKVRDESVLVRDIRHLGGTRYNGRLYGFEPSFALTFMGLSLDTIVEFDESEIVSCG